MALPKILTRETPTQTIISDFRKPLKMNSFDVNFEKGSITHDVVDFSSMGDTKAIPHMDTNFRLYQEIYQKVPVAKIAVDHTANFAIQSGYELEGPAYAVQSIEKWIDKVNFNHIIKDAMIQMQIYGNAYLDISDISMPKFLPVNTMHVVVKTGSDNDGEIDSYIQKINSKEPITLSKDELVHFKWNNESGLDGGFYGISDMKSATTTLRRLLNFQEDIGDAIHRFASPLIHWIVGSENSPGSRQQVEDFKSTLGDREHGGDLITSFGIDSKAIATDLRMIQPDGILEHFENQLIAAFQVPEIFIRGGKSANKATADVELQAFDRRVKAIRNVVTMFIEDFVFPRISVSSGKVKIAWNEPNFQTETSKAEMVERMTKAGIPLEVSFKIVGWGGYMNDLKAAGGQVMPMMQPFGGSQPGSEPQKGDNNKPKEPPMPKEEDFDSQLDWARAYVKWKESINRVTQ